MNYRRSADISAAAIPFSAEEIKEGQRDGE
jgi:hypothetical protein